MLMPDFTSSSFHLIWLAMIWKRSAILSIDLHTFISFYLYIMFYVSQFSLLYSFFVKTRSYTLYFNSSKWRSLLLSSLQGKKSVGRVV